MTLDQNKHLLSTHVNPKTRVSTDSYLVEERNSIIVSEELIDNCDDSVSCSSSTDSKKQSIYTDHEFPLHWAAEKGKLKLLRRLLLHEGNLFITDSKLRTPLHYACEFAYQKTALKLVNTILDSKKAQNTFEDRERRKRLIDLQDENGETALHVAARTAHNLVVEKLLNISADVNIRDINNIEPLQLIYSKVPTAMKHIFDDAISCKVGDPQDENLVAEFDFGVLVGHPGCKDNLDASLFKMETGLLSYCLQQPERKREEILLHPIVQTFLFLKWKKIRTLLWFSVFVHIMWLLMSSLFITDLYLCQCPYKGINKESITCKVGTGALISLNSMASFVLLSSVLVAIKKFYEIVSTPQFKFYMSHFENVGQWVLIIILLILCTPLFMKNVAVNDDIVIDSWQYPMSAFGIVVAWSLILCQIGKIPRFGTFIEMLVKVLQSFVMFMITFSSLFVAFILSFQIIMPEKLEFKTFPWGITKIMAMMIGEFEYDEEFYGKDSSTRAPFPTSTKLLYAIFMSTVTIILYNLLIGLTVSDIQGLQKGGQLSSLSRQLEQISMIEKVVMSKRLQGWLVKIDKKHWIRYFLVTQQTTDPNEDFVVDIQVSDLPTELQIEVRKVAIPDERQANEDGDEEYEMGEIIYPDADPNIEDENNLDGDGREKEDGLRLREQIKDVLRELLVELKVENPQSKRVL